VWSSTQTPHYVHRARRGRCRGGAHPRHRDPNGGGFGGKAIRSTRDFVANAALCSTARQDPPHALVGLMPPRAASGADDLQDRRHERRRDHRHAREDAGDGAYGLRVASTPYTGAL
jgi:hypothetical protein